MMQRFIDINVFDSKSKEIINGLCIQKATGQQLNAVLQLAPANSIIEIAVIVGEVSTPTVK